jgi:hypothetical protein
MSALCGRGNRRLSQAEKAAWRFRGHVVLDGWHPEGKIVRFKQAE